MPFTTPRMSLEWNDLLVRQRSTSEADSHGQDREAHYCNRGRRKCSHVTSPAVEKGSKQESPALVGSTGQRRPKIVSPREVRASKKLGQKRVARQNAEAGSKPNAW